MAAVWRDREAVNKERGSGARDGSVGDGSLGCPDLATFNQHVLACQDQAFTLAAMLLGNDRAADRVVEAAVRSAHRQTLVPSGATTASGPTARGATAVCGATASAVRVAVLREVLRLCGPPWVRREARMPAPLARLPERERLLLVAVDVLGLDYDEAAAVLGWSRPALAAALAAARGRLVAQGVGQETPVALTS